MPRALHLSSAAGRKQEAVTTSGSNPCRWSFIRYTLYMLDKALGSVTGLCFLRGKCCFHQALHELCPCSQHIQHVWFDNVGSRSWRHSRSRYSRTMARLSWTRRLWRRWFSSESVWCGWRHGASSQVRQCVAPLFAVVAFGRVLSTSSTTGDTQLQAVLCHIEGMLVVSLGAARLQVALFW